MKHLKISTFVFLSATLSTFGTAKGAVSKTLRLEGEDAQNFFRLLYVPATQVDGVQRKSFRSADNQVQINCEKSETASVCELGMDSKDETATLSGVAAQGLWAALNLPVFPGRVGDSKYYSDSENRLALQCSQTFIPNGNRYVCEVGIEN